MEEMEELKGMVQQLQDDFTRFKESYTKKMDMCLINLTMSQKLRNILDTKTDCIMVSDLGKHPKIYYISLQGMGQKMLYELECIMSMFGVTYAPDK